MSTNRYQNKTHKKRLQSKMQKSAPSKQNTKNAAPKAKRKESDSLKVKRKKTTLSKKKV